jgi:hypothetical protein
MVASHQDIQNIHIFRTFAKYRGHFISSIKQHKGQTLGTHFRKNLNQRTLTFTLNANIKNDD